MDQEFIMNQKDFPILKQKVNGKRLVYLDSAATSQKPQVVIDAISEYYKTYNSNIHRSIHTLSQKATNEFEKTRKTVADFINAKQEEVIFTKGTTESLNVVAHALKDRIRKGDEIVLTIMEHHSNIVPWQQVAKERGAVLKYIPITKYFRLDMAAANKLITKKTKIVAITHMSNVLGTINPVKDIAKLAHAVGALVVVDGAQSVPSMKIDVKDLDCDFLAFSSHKMCGPTGVGVLYGKYKLLEAIEPFDYGGHMIKEVTLQDATWNEIPWKFEGGTSNIADVIAFGKAIEYLNSIGMDKIEKHEQELTAYTLQQLKKMKQIKVIGPSDMKQRGPIVSFHVEGMHPHDVSELADREGVALRGGHHCCMPLMKSLDIPGCSRASFYLYNTEEDVDVLVSALQKALKVFRL
jgi:cysteine desulfurase/selenocysteine lyase